MKPKVLFVSGKSNGCNFYRILQPAIKLIEMDYPAALTAEMTTEELEGCLSRSDVIVTQHFSEKMLDYIASRGNQKFIFDYDDNIFDVSPFNPAYQYHGIEEVDIIKPNGEKVEIRDGKNGFDLKANRHRLFLFAETMRRADMVTTPSPILAGVFKKYNKNVRVVKNLIDTNVWKPLPIVKDDTVRIGYQGGWAHYEDFLAVSESIRVVMEKFKNVVFTIMGQTYDGAMEGLPKERVERERWVDMSVYPYKFKTLNIDIGIAPLQDRFFNRCKSELKWEEYGSLGIPCVASNIPPYQTAITHGKTGFLADSSEWIDFLSKLIQDKGLRLNVGEQARQEIVGKYGLDREILQYTNAFDSLYNREIVLAK